MTLNDSVTFEDRDYTPSESVIAAVWPDVHQTSVSWKIVSDQSASQWSYKATDSVMKYSDYDCASPEVLACGSTTVSAFRKYHPNDKVCISL